MTLLSPTRPFAVLHGAGGAASVFAAHEGDGTSFTEVSELSGVPRATLDYYFARKDDTLAFVLQSLVDDIARRVADALASGDAPIHRLRAVLAAQLEVLGANPDAASCSSRSSVALVASRTSHRLWTPRSTSLYETSPRPVRPMARYDRSEENGQRDRKSTRLHSSH